MNAMTLRAMEPEDIEMIYKWENDPTVWVQSAAHQPFSRQVLQRFIEESASCDIFVTRQLRLMADVEGTGCVGCVDLFDFDPWQKHASVGILVDSRMRRRGFGLAMLEKVHHFVIEHLDLHQLYCEISINNNASIGLFMKCGYELCGSKKEWIREEGVWTAVECYQKIF